LVGVVVEEEWVAVDVGGVGERRGVTSVVSEHLVGEVEVTFTVYFVA
jgi:hypothetical protein